MHRVFIDCPRCDEPRSVLFAYERNYGRDRFEVEQSFCDCSVKNLNEEHHEECRLRAIAKITNPNP